MLLHSLRQRCTSPVTQRLRPAPTPLAVAASRLPHHPAVGHGSCSTRDESPPRPCCLRRAARRSGSEARSCSAPGRSTPAHTRLPFAYPRPRQAAPSSCGPSSRLAAVVSHPVSLTRHPLPDLAGIPAGKPCPRITNGRGHRIAPVAGAGAGTKFCSRARAQDTCIRGHFSCCHLWGGGGWGG